MTKAPELKPCPCGEDHEPFVNDGKCEEHWIEDMKNACPYCSGSGHKDDVRADLHPVVKPLPRGRKGLPWELDWALIDSLHKEACSYEDGSATHVAVEVVALAVERQILSALAPVTPAQAAKGDRLHTIRQMPPEICPKGVPVLVAGGIAMKKTGGKWFSGMSEPAFERELNWEPEWWSNIPQGNEPLRAIAEGEI